MKKKILKLIMIILLAAIGLVIGGYLNFFGYRSWTKLTPTILSKQGWFVEANGMYNYINFYQDNSFKVYEFPNEIDSGKWKFENKLIGLDFQSEVPDRIYEIVGFDNRQILHLKTDGNEERFVSDKK